MRRGSHAYAVLDVQQVDRVRLLQVKNPWAHKRWKGAYSARDTQRWTPFLKSRLRVRVATPSLATTPCYRTPPRHRFSQRGARFLWIRCACAVAGALLSPTLCVATHRCDGASQYDPEDARQYDNGIFWIDYDSMLKFYRSIYFNWNPDLFACRRVRGLLARTGVCALSLNRLPSPSHVPHSLCRCGRRSAGSTCTLAGALTHLDRATTATTSATTPSSGWW